VGDSYIDVAIRCDHIPLPGQSVTGAGFSYTAAGSGPLQAVQAALCGCQVHLVSKIGSDPFREVLRQSLVEFGIETEFVHTAEAKNSGLIITLVNGKGENAAVSYAGANTALGLQEIKSAEEVISQADICLVAGELPQETIIEAIRCAKLHGRKVVFNPAAPMPSYPHQQGEFELPAEYFNADIMIANLSEATGIVEQSAAISARRETAKLVGSDLVARGVGSAVITMGRRGSMVVDRQGADHIDAFDVELVDQTGRGDAFVGALAAYCAVADDVRQAAEFASAAGALTCTRFGSIEAMPSKAEIIELLQREETA
jgi:ribokinase